jgi:hypothetical protein
VHNRTDMDTKAQSTPTPQGPKMTPEDAISRMPELYAEARLRPDGSVRRRPFYKCLATLRELFGAAPADLVPEAVFKCLQQVADQAGESPPVHPPAGPGAPQPPKAPNPALVAAPTLPAQPGPRRPPRKPPGRKPPQKRKKAKICWRPNTFYANDAEARIFADDRAAKRMNRYASGHPPSRSATKQGYTQDVNGPHPIRARGLPR